MAKPLNAMYGGYGAYELKVKYQKNLFLGIVFCAALVAVTVGAAYLYRALTAVETVYVQPTIIKTIADLGPPPTVAKKPPRMDISAPKRVAPKVGIPKPVADDEILDDEEVVIASREELAEIVAPQMDPSAASDGQDIVVAIPDEEYLPAPDEFVPVEIPAEMIYEEIPEYPRQARAAGMEAVVWIQALVDKDGNVRKAQVQKSSGSRGGFDEAAVAAAYKCKYKPAIQNGRPVPVWVSYMVEFELESSR
ncbi:MAG: energy transducer TonB [Candidatus Zixiibacteriota bacterium]|nr:MAG: energy transducer TonB [candidate division Zixibacteria bacterium]